MEDVGSCSTHRISPLVDVDRSRRLQLACVPDVYRTSTDQTARRTSRFIGWGEATTFVRRAGSLPRLIGRGIVCGPAIDLWWLAAIHVGLDPTVTSVQDRSASQGSTKRDRYSDHLLRNRPPRMRRKGGSKPATRGLKGRSAGSLDTLGSSEMHLRPAVLRFETVDP